MMDARIYKTTDPFYLPGSGQNQSTAVLMIHGFTGSPSEFRRVGYHLQDLGHTVQAIRLPGHGTSPKNMIRTNWTDWYGHVLESYDELASLSFERIIVMGHSMGGLLALKLAVERKVDGLITLATPIYLSSRKTALAGLLQYFVRYIDKRPSAQNTSLDEACAYTKTPIRCVVSLRKLLKQVKRSLSEVDAPIFIGHGLRDTLALHQSADFIQGRIGSAIKKTVYYPQTSHGVLLDQEREQVYEDITSFIGSLQSLHYQIGTALMQ
jgi:carboxylesterase